MNSDSPALLVCGVGSNMEVSIEDLLDVAASLWVVSDRRLDRLSSPQIRYIQAYPRSEDDVLRALKEHEVNCLDGVFSLGYENPRVIARVAAEFGCPGLPYTVAARCALKDLRIERLMACGLRVPRFQVVRCT